MYVCMYVLCVCVYISYTQMYIPQLIYIYTHTHTHTTSSLAIHINGMTFVKPTIRSIVKEEKKTKD